MSGHATRGANAGDDCLCNMLGLKVLGARLKISETSRRRVRSRERPENGRGIRL
jgi:hypothetical protein